MQQPDPHNHVTVFQRLAPGKDEYALLFWVALTAGVILTVFLISSYMDMQVRAFRSIGIYMALGLVTVPLAIHVCYGIFRNWAAQAGHFARHRKPEIADWLHADFAFIKGDRVMAAAGVSLGTLSVLTFHWGEYFSAYPQLPAVFLALVMFVSAAFAGMGLYAMFCASRTFWRMGKLEHMQLKVHEHRFGVLSIGAALFRCWIIIGLVWAIYTATAFVGYTGLTPAEIFILPPMWLLAYPTLPFIVGSFIVCQIPLHRKMVDYKRQEIRRLDEMLDEISPTNVSDINGELRSNIDFLEKKRAQLRALPDWPFNKVSLIGTGASSLAAMMPMLANEHFPKWISDVLKVMLT